MIHVLVEPEKNIRTAVEENLNVFIKGSDYC